MQTQACDVIGCGRPAAWQRVEGEKSLREELLCHACWMQQHTDKSRTTPCYLPCEPAVLASFVEGEERIRTARAAVITIGA